ncbi:MAG: hypothetical protein A2700_01580 [Candidatus Blackburnbacteria bacterium RIFCSPHIGHO2_01_FULL_44_64]|uniref:Glycosyltransferase 2-like domain-containing protein n=1 Tax=Candidatus Blackburnbacteria bacterium RIFCSPHIGHO2_02_FULL_44_20 TaxID=1797516 RepID=A0A1G1V951_9BACT|nr:MAG: hypothetical protein A2700_01580 [Candidatus Blackburnbacteria bacterium RIFCSPHIGHO2_01_FULL_44_64]OGY11250.1 MAG: hypothetical protein A3E16_01630 [Candidatus Blackburnbacteria bacterium RIFCSPHIGHO2_12_FULL_44_25]OGY11939.1 MAG: hypothetical protein A3D26_03040 [Candidatus Blackburnbacteria bacterium RIFCSPHIGHO2_02_FULL_44_20]OGY13348.1 MAG: hypothetical protein A3A62_03595 [Candidatus Blackburnbacteria bacterium RIFCSPLOWO2_01_FULL_44_43]OGY15368.1 MAG: hypothetical protein A3H88_0
MKFVILIPTYNEKENISLLLSKIVKTLANSPGWKVLVVDDNSPDGTAKEVKKHPQYKKKILLLQRSKKEGLGNAYLAGMEESFNKLKADFVITMDSDLSHQPKYIVKFIEKIKDGRAFIVGSRYIPGGSIPKEWPPHRKFLSIFGNSIVPFFIGSRKLTDWTSGFRAIKKEVYEKVRPKILRDHAQNKGYTFNISFAYHAVKLNLPVGEVPIHFPDRTKGESKLGLEYLIHTPVFLLRTRLRS